MKPDSSPPALPLADAIKSWSDRQLVDAVQAAEAPFSPTMLERHQREWLADTVEARSKSRHALPYAADDRVRALHRAWHALFASFGAVVASGAVVLFGRMLKPFRREDADALPASWGRQLLYYPLRGTIIYQDDAYEDVTAARQSDAVTYGERLREARIARGEVPLIEALRAWGDPALIGEVCRCERRHSAHEMARMAALPRLLDLAELRQPSSTSWMAGPPDYTQLLAGWTALENDFRARLVRGEFRLSGVMAKPHRRLQPEILPGVWAADFAFDFRRDAVSFDDAKYVAVTVTNGAAPSAAQVAGRPDGEIQGPVTGPTISPTNRVQSTRPPGRKSGKPIVAQALRAQWAWLFPKGAPANPGPWTELAKRLVRRVETTGNPPGAWFPDEDTVRKHLAEIYAEVLAEKGAAVQSGQ